MEANIVTNLLLPLALGVVMLGLGMHLGLDDFRRVLRYPKAILVGLLTQSVLLVVVAALIALALRLPPELAVGLMLLAASPGGATANLLSHLARGDVALNISLTAVNSVLCLLSLPLIINASLSLFMDSAQAVPPPLRKVIEVALIVVLPVAIGMLLRAQAPRWADRLGRPVGALSVLVLLGLIIWTVVLAWDDLPRYFAAVGLACLLFNLASLGLGYGVSRLARLPRPQAVAIAMEIGVHNAALAIYVALNVLQNPTMSVPAAVYALLMYFTAGAVVFWARRAATR